MVGHSAGQEANADQNRLGMHRRYPPTLAPVAGLGLDSNTTAAGYLLDPKARQATVTYTVRACQSEWMVTLT